MTVIKHSDLDFVDLPGRRSADPLAETDSQSSARYVKLEYSSDRTAHFHPLSEELIFVVKGSGHIWLDGQRLDVEAGDIVHVGTGLAHATVPDSGVKMELMCFFPHPNLSENIVNTDIAVVDSELDDSAVVNPATTEEPCQ